ncbi:LOW QUALITY PROTEIN: solute carrier family 35 member F5 [Nilaparvata lugens]|uniref:LOW QUALITY PROTEIN: solute carrier family 35 member F5 n=1 Tax=Nilaparvata lugens TaxID=108931 RepID=UPI000B994874|nr:LOW QUALITY PROTEIN: solute carrier family 35 member F5 [Nilaparvata lugens]
MSALEVRTGDPFLGGMLNKSQRLMLGLFVLLLVDVIWVSSSELTKYIYKNAKFEKPFFSTYLKTSMFSVYLLGLCLWPPWRDQCNRPSNYMYIEPDMDDESFYTEANTSLSDPTFVPIKFPERNERNSGTESDDSSVQRSVRFSKLAEVRHMSESDAKEALLARLSYQASLRANDAARRQACKLGVDKVAKLALVFCLLWFVANYTFQAALSETESAVATALSSSSSLFTLLLSALFPSNLGDRFSLSKLVAVFVSICGLILVSLSDMSTKVQVPFGAILSLISAFFYACYLVLLRRKVDHEDKMDIPVFFGFVGLFNFLLLWPMFFLLHYTHWESFEWPNKHQWTFLLINGLVGTVFSEVLWLWGCFLTSSLIATVAMSLTIPMSMLADVLFERVHYPGLFYLGSLPMVLSFITVTILAHYENHDPVLEGLRRLFSCWCSRGRPIRISECEVEQTESLIGINDSADHEA